MKTLARFCVAALLSTAASSFAQQDPMLEDEELAIEEEPTSGPEPMADEELTFEAEPMSEEEEPTPPDEEYMPEPESEPEEDLSSEEEPLPEEGVLQY